MDTGVRFPIFPGFVARPLELLPLAPASMVLAAVARCVARENPYLFNRLGDHAAKQFLIEPTDLPMAFLLHPTPGKPTIRAIRKDESIGYDCRIAGPLSALLALIHGAEDGDALFFSRDIITEGDTEAVLALRNALDNAEIDLFTTAAALLGKPGRISAGWLHPVLMAASRMTGVMMTRNVIMK